MHSQRGPGVSYIRKQKQEREYPCKARDSPGLAPKSQEKTVLGSWQSLRKKSQEFSLAENYPFGHRENISLHQFLQGTKLEMNIRLHGVAFLVPLCWVRVTHPLDLSSNTTSSRKSSLTWPPGQTSFFVLFMRPCTPLRHFSLLGFYIYLPAHLLQISFSLTGIDTLQSQKLTGFASFHVSALQPVTQKCMNRIR